MHHAPQETRTYFVTAVTANRRRLFQVIATADLLQQTLLDYHGQGKFLLHAWVIMPDHFHALLTPASDVSLEKAMQYIKGGFSFGLKSKQDVWTRSFNESQIRTQDKFEASARYIEENPVRKHLAPTAQAYPHSSARKGRPDPMPSHLQGESPSNALPSIRSLKPPTPPSQEQASTNHLNPGLASSARTEQGPYPLTIRANRKDGGSRSLFHLTTMHPKFARSAKTEGTGAFRPLTSRPQEPGL